MFIALQARALGMGTLDEPGAGLLAFCLGVLMAVVAIGDGLYTVMRRRRESSVAPWTLPGRQIKVIVALLLYIALLEPAGFLLSTFAFLLAVFIAIGKQSWPRSIAYAVAGSGICHALFKLALGVQRFTFDAPQFIDGMDVITLIVGLFGVSEVLFNLEQNVTRSIIEGKIQRILPSLAEWRASRWPIARGSALGFLLGLLPGGGGVIASFASYAVEKRVSAIPERFGHGAIEGVAGPEAANNAAASSAFIPLILMFCVIGVYGTTGSVFFLYLMAGFGVLGYLLRRSGHDLAPLVLGFVLGPLLEVHLRRSLIAGEGDWSFFVTRPISAACLAAALLLAIGAALPALKRWRKTTLVDD